MLRRRSEREDQPSPEFPRTKVGQFLRAAVLIDVELRRKLSAKLGGDKPGWNYDEPAVVQAACELAVRRLWSGHYDIRDITAAVTFIRDANAAARGTAGYGQLEMEAVIRSALGETDIDLSGIIPPTVFEIQGAVTGYAVLKLRLSEGEIDGLIVEAENIAFQRGWNPPLA
jgi:hypothetical protein